MFKILKLCTIPLQAEYSHYELEKHLIYAVTVIVLMANDMSMINRGGYLNILFIFDSASFLLMKPVFNTSSGFLSTLR